MAKKEKREKNTTPDSPRVWNNRRRPTKEEQDRVGGGQIYEVVDTEPVVVTARKRHKNLFTSDKYDSGLPEPNLNNGVRALKEDDLNISPMDERQYMDEHDLEIQDGAEYPGAWSVSEPDILPPGSEPNLGNGVRGIKKDDLVRHSQRPTSEDISDKESLDPYGRTRKAVDAAMRSWRQMLIDNHNRRMAQNQKQVRNAQILGIGKALGDMIGAIWGGAASLRNNAVAVVPQAQASKTAQQIEKLINEGVVEAKDYDNMMFNLAMQKGKSDIELAKALDELGIKSRELQAAQEYAAAVREEQRQYNEEQQQRKWDHEAAVREEKRKYDKQKPKDKPSPGYVNRSLGDSPVIRGYIDSYVQKEYDSEYEETDPLTGITEKKKRKQRISESDREAQRKHILQDITSIHKYYKIPSSAPDVYPLGWERFIKDTLSGLGRKRIEIFLGAGFSSSDIIEYYESVDGGTIDIQSDKFAKAIKTKSDIDKVKVLKKGGVKLRDLLTALQARSIDQIYNALTGDE